MGNNESIFTETQLDVYQDCTFFNRKDILRVFARFRQLDPVTVPLDMTHGHTSTIKMASGLIQDMPELRENPFRMRICQVFSDDGGGDLTFDQFLDMFSVFSEAATREVKAVYAFKIYDNDQDNHLGREDLIQTLKALTQDALSPEEVEFVVAKVLEETDLDDDGLLSYIEFEHVISKSPEFLNNFHIRI